MHDPKTAKAITKADSVTENVLRISELIDSFYEAVREEGKTSKKLKLGFTHNPIPQFTHKKIQYHGPEDYLANITFAQYIAANDALHDYYESKDPEHLDTLVAALYLQQGKKYDPKTIDGNAAQFQNLDIALKYGVFLFFASCQQFMANCTNLTLKGGKSINISVVFKQGTASNGGTNIGLVGTLYSLAETQVWGNLEKTANANMLEVIVYLANKHFENEKIKSNAKNSPTK